MQERRLTLHSCNKIHSACISLWSWEVVTIRCTLRSINIWTGLLSLQWVSPAVKPRLEKLETYVDKCMEGIIGDGELVRELSPMGLEHFVWCWWQVPIVKEYAFVSCSLACWHWGKWVRQTRCASASASLVFMGPWTTQSWSRLWWPGPQIGLESLQQANHEVEVEKKQVQ